MEPVELLQELIRVDTTNPPGNEGVAAEILRSYLDASRLKTELFTSDEGRVSLVARIPGPTDRAPLVLVSHTDVVGVEPDRWTRDPFGGEVADGFIWGRGTLDMKGIAVMHAVAAAALAESDATPSREVIVVSVADEEAGGAQGIRQLLDQDPGALGFSDGITPVALGEGAFGLSGVLERPVMAVAVGEKTALWVALHAKGDPGHGSLPPDTQVPLNLARAITKLAGSGRPRVHPVMRSFFETISKHAAQPNRSVFKGLASGAAGPLAAALKKPLSASGTIGLSLWDTVTPTIVNAGYKSNVVPGEGTATLDCRLLPDTDPDGFVARLQKECSPLGIAVDSRSQGHGPVSQRGPLFDVIESHTRRMSGQPLVAPYITPGVTDLRFLRAKGATAYGWVPLVLDQDLLGTIHGHDERVPLDGFEAAVTTMTEAVAAFSS